MRGGSRSLDRFARRSSELFGFAPVMITRSARQLSRIARSHPHAALVADAKYLHVGFLAATPDRSLVAALDPERSPPDVVTVRGAEAYLAFPRGSARSKLTVDYLDRTLGTTSTWRNWNTVQKLVALVDDA